MGQPRTNRNNHHEAHKSVKLLTFVTLYYCCISSFIHISLAANSASHDTHGWSTISFSEPFARELTSDFDQDDFKIEGHIAESVEDEILSRGRESEQRVHLTSSTTEPSTNIRHHFSKHCPLGYFACDNGECLSPKWRCDGHYDCDDFSDELNCTLDTSTPSSLASPVIFIKSERPTMLDGHFSEARTQSSLQPRQSSTTPAPPPTPKSQVAKVEHQEPPTGEQEPIKFNSSQEPLMLFSTGNSIRGYWMSNRIYFDIVSSPGSHTSHIDHRPPPTITQALSIFFGIFSPEVHPPVAPKGPSGKAHGSSEDSRSKSTIVGIDMDPENKEVFWVELGKDAGVYSSMIDEDEFDPRHRRQLVAHKPIVDYGLMSPEDVALDSIGKNLYITDAGLPAIIVCSVKHSDCKIIVNENLHKPRAIIVDSTTGWLIYSDWGDHPGIFLASMDGQHRETLIDTDVVWPNGLASDYSANHLYWADARLSKIERVDLNTRKRKVIIKEAVSNPFSLSIFEDRLYWSDWSGNIIKTCDKTTGNSSRTIMHAENIYGIHIYHPHIYAKTIADQSNPCWSKRCSHLCLLAPKSSSYADKRIGAIDSSCACPESMTLSNNDGTTCYPSELSFVLLTVRNYIAQMFPEHIGLETIERIVYSRNHIIHDVTADWHSMRLFFFDAAKGYIYQLFLPDYENHIQARVEKFIPSNPSTRSMVYDTLGANLYWLDSDNGTVTMCSTITKYSVIVRHNLDRPTSLVLDTMNRVFYISTMGNSPHIMRMSIEGDESKDLIIIDDVGLPVSLHLEDHSQRLYWADSKQETIESVLLDVKDEHGYKVHSRITHRHRVGTVLAFTVYKKHLIWTVQNGDYLFKVPLADDLGTGVRLSSDKSPIAYKLPPNPSSKEPTSDNTRLILVEPANLPTSSPCEKVKCSHACIVPEDLSAVCVCPSPTVEGSFILTNVTSMPCVEFNMTSIATTVNPIIGPPSHANDHKATHQNSARVPIPQHKLAGSTIISTSKPEAHSLDSIHQSFVTQPNHPETIHSDTSGHVEHLKGELSHPSEESGAVVWPLVLLLLLSIAALIVIISLLILHRQGRLPRQVSHLSVSFIPQSHDKDGAMLLLDSDA